MSSPHKVMGAVAPSPWIGDMTMWTVTAIHAGYAGNNATLAFPGPFTQPTQPRTLTATFNASWDGGTVTVVGTDIKGRTISEVFTPGAGTTVVGKKQFATVVSAAKSLVGASATTASIGNDAIRSAPVNMENFSLAGWQFAWPATGTPVGSIGFEGSNAYDRERPEDNDQAWTDLPVDGSLINPPTGAAGTTTYSHPQYPFSWIRAYYLATSGGSGARLTAIVNMKKR